MNLRQIVTSTSDVRGRILDVLYKDEINHIAIVETDFAGVIRGNHYHKQSTQHIFMVRGALRYWYQPVDKSQPIQSVLINEYSLVTTPPYEIHALEMIGPSQFMVFTHGLRGGIDYESDTFREFVILTPDMLSR